VRAGRPLRTDHTRDLRLRACGQCGPPSLTQHLRKRRVQLELWIAPWLVESFLNLPQRDRPYRGSASGIVTVSDEQDPLGGRIDLVTRDEKIHAGTVSQPLARYRYCDLIIDIELGQRSFLGTGGAMR
jgi:hypothetical protein